MTSKSASWQTGTQLGLSSNISPYGHITVGSFKQHGGVSYYLHLHCLSNSFPCPFWWGSISDRQILLTDIYLLGKGFHNITSLWFDILYSNSHVYLTNSTRWLSVSIRHKFNCCISSILRSVQAMPLLHEFRRPLNKNKTWSGEDCKNFVD